MANTHLTPDIILKEGFRVLRNNCPFINAMGSKYDDTVRRQAAVEYYIRGNIKAVAEHMGINRTTILNWKNQDWFQDMLQECADECEDKIRAGYDAIIDKAIDETLDRLDNGDVYMHQGAPVRAPVRAKDAATIAAIAYDKRRISLNLPTSITANASTGKQLENLAQQFRDLTVRFDKKTDAIPATKYSELQDNEHDDS